MYHQHERTITRVDIIDRQRLAFNALRSIEAYKHQMNHVDNVTKIVGEELKICQERHDEFETLIEDTKQEVVKLKASLLKEKHIRAEKEQCEALGRQINQYPTREESAREIERLSGALELVDKRYDDVVGKMELRTKQVRLLMQTIHDLQNVLSEDDKTDAMDID